MMETIIVHAASLLLLMLALLFAASAGRSIEHVWNAEEITVKAMISVALVLAGWAMAVIA